jgi:hypothetical protein
MKILNKTDDAIIDMVTPIVESMQVGWDSGNYEQFSEYFSNEMKSGVNKENFLKQRKELMPELGKHLKMDFVATHKNPGNLIVMWRLFFTNREIPALVTYIFCEKKANYK